MDNNSFEKNNRKIEFKNFIKRVLIDLFIILSVCSFVLIIYLFLFQLDEKYHFMRSKYWPTNFFYRMNLNDRTLNNFTSSKISFPHTNTLTQKNINEDDLNNEDFCDNEQILKIKSLDQGHYEFSIVRNNEVTITGLYKNNSSKCIAKDIIIEVQISDKNNNILQTGKVYPSTIMRPDETVEISVNFFVDSNYLVQKRNVLGLDQSLKSGYKLLTRIIDVNFIDFK